MKKLFKFLYYKYIFLYNAISTQSDFNHNLKAKSLNNKFILISQLQKSGGHLLLNLLDGHPYLNVYPMELRLNKERKKHQFFDESFFHVKKHNGQIFHLIKEKVSTPLLLNNKKNKTKNFIFNIRKQRKIFDQNKSKCLRYNFNLYFFSFFHSWKNYFKKFDKGPIVFFIPQFCSNEDSMKKYYSYFKNSYHIYICRDPLTWANSISNYRPEKFKNISFTLKFYIQHKKNFLKSMNKNRTIVINFEKLIQKPKLEINKILKKLNLKYHQNNSFLSSNLHFTRSLSHFKFKEYKKLTNIHNKKIKISKNEWFQNKKLITEAYSLYNKTLKLSKI